MAKISLERNVFISAYRLGSQRRSPGRGRKGVMLLLAHSACLLRPTRIMGPGWYCPSGLGPPHWSLIRKMSHRLHYGRGIFSIEVPSFQMTLAHSKSTQNSPAFLLTSLYTLQFQEHLPVVSGCGLEGTALCLRECC